MLNMQFFQKNIYELFRGKGSKCPIERNDEQSINPHGTEQPHFFRKTCNVTYFIFTTAEKMGWMRIECHNSRTDTKFLSLFFRCVDNCLVPFMQSVKKTDCKGIVL